MKRLVITLLTSVAILFQGLAFAWISPAMSLPAQPVAEHTAMPCHDKVMSADDGSSHTSPKSCCDQPACPFMQICHASLALNSAQDFSPLLCAHETQLLRLPRLTRLSPPQRLRPPISA